MKTRIAWLIVAAMLAGIGAARAATPSFLCAKAKGWMQTTICASERLSDLYLQLAVGYARMLRVTSGTGRRSLEDEQRAWSASRNECRDASAPAACQIAISTRSRRSNRGPTIRASAVGP